MQTCHSFFLAPSLFVIELSPLNCYWIIFSPQGLLSFDLNARNTSKVFSDIHTLQWVFICFVSSDQCFCQSIEIDWQSISARRHFKDVTHLVWSIKSHLWEECIFNKSFLSSVLVWSVQSCVNHVFFNFWQFSQIWSNSNHTSVIL